MPIDSLLDVKFMISSLKPVDRIEFTILVDNYTDMLLVDQTDHVKRPKPEKGLTLVAEHGFSVLIRVWDGDESHCILMDTGATDYPFFENADRLGIGLDPIEEIVLSHGHFDHFGSLVPLLRKQTTRIAIHMHPDSFHERRKKNPDGSYTNLLSLNRDLLTNVGAILNLSTEPSMIANRHILLTGEIERTTSFEQGSPVLEIFEKGEWIKDHFRDDQSLVMILKDHGLVVLSGCAHAGIINSVEYARKITGIDIIHALLGGFHLSGPGLRDVILPTVEAMRDFEPEWVVPMHCTGWEATSRFMEAMPGRVILNTVGTRYCFDSGN